MKEVILSADGDSVVYLVPDVVAENLAKYCIRFCDRWLKTSPKAKKYRVGDGVCYDEGDFIEYLNLHVFPKGEQSVLVKNLGRTDLGRNLPEEYRDHPYFNF